MATRPYDYQRTGVKLIVNKFKGRVLMADEMSLGKTPQSLWAAKKLTQPGDTILVVCPKTLKENWRRECLKHVGARACVLSGIRPPRYGLPPNTDGVYVINYDILKAVQHPAVKSQRRTWGNLLRDLAPTVVIADEGHMLKNSKAGRTKAVRALAHLAPFAMILTGTPMTNRPADLWSLLNILKPDLFPSFVIFGREFCGPKRKPWGWEYLGATNIPKLNRVLRTEIMVRRRKDDVLKDLPEKRRVMVALELPKKERAEYDVAYANFLEWLAVSPRVQRRNQRLNNAAKAVELSKITYIKHLIGQLKMGLVTEWIDNFLESSDDKLLVFAVHRAVVNGMKRHYGDRAVMIHGGVVGHKRQLAIDAFNADPRRRLLFGNVVAAGVGWSCTSTPFDATIELGWRPDEHQQAESRTHGLHRGGNRKSTSYYLVAANTIEERLCRILQKKQDVATETLDGRVNGREMNVYELLMNQLARKAGK